jgi:hypothetical protein
MEVGMPAMNPLFRRPYPRKDPACHRQNFWWRISLIAACQHLLKRSVGSCGAGFYLQRSHTAAGHFSDARVSNDRPHRTNHQITVCATVE